MANTEQTTFLHIALWLKVCDISNEMNDLFYLWSFYVFSITHPPPPQHDHSYGSQVFRKAHTALPHAMPVSLTRTVISSPFWLLDSLFLHLCLQATCNRWCIVLGFVPAGTCSVSSLPTFTLCKTTCREGEQVTWFCAPSQPASEKRKTWTSDHDSERRHMHL